jgi:hypothetical protein
MVWHWLVPGAQTVTDTFGMFTKFAAPLSTVIGTALLPFAAIGWLVPDPDEPPPELPPPELLVELSSPEPQAASAVANIATDSQRSARWKNREGELLLMGVGRM